jgi:hypothetical protein
VSYSIYCKFTVACPPLTQPFALNTSPVDVSLTSLGTVFAVTGGLAAPALAAGLGGLATLTGAGTASSTAILAVLATFKAGR